jgi:hypothetical protein
LSLKPLKLSPNAPQRRFSQSYPGHEFIPYNAGSETFSGGGGSGITPGTLVTAPLTTENSVAAAGGGGGRLDTSDAQRLHSSLTGDVDAPYPMRRCAIDPGEVDRAPASGRSVLLIR